MVAALALLIAATDVPPPTNGHDLQWECRAATPNGEVGRFIIQSLPNRDAPMITITATGADYLGVGAHAFAPSQSVRGPQSADDIIFYFRNENRLYRVAVQSETGERDDTSVVTLHRFGSNEGAYPIAVAAGFCTKTASVNIGRPQAVSMESTTQPPQPLPDVVTSLAFDHFAIDRCAALKADGVLEQFRLGARLEGSNFVLTLDSEGGRNWLPPTANAVVPTFQRRGGVLGSIIVVSAGQLIGRGRLIADESENRINMWFHLEPGIVAICDVQVPRPQGGRSE